jgi:hypothetical protein
MVGGFVLLWSSAFSVGKIAIADCPPLIFLAIRFLAAGVLMLGLAAVSGFRWTLSKRDVAVFAALGVGPPPPKAQPKKKPRVWAPRAGDNPHEPVGIGPRKNHNPAPPPTK